MEWVLQSPQIHSTFSNLGYAYSDGYHINENCNVALESILHNILTEDKYLRNYRRNISFGQNIKKDLIPLLINVKEDKSIKLLIQIFVNLTTPIECLFNVEEISRSDFGRHTIFEINNLLTSTKAALTDNRATKVIIDFLKKNAECELMKRLPMEQRNNVGNALLFLRNILHIPEDVHNINPNYNGPLHTVQNQIMWNLFSQSIDKVLIKLMSVPDARSWGITMVQLVALLYKDQHVTTLHKLLNAWLETSLSESSEDNESNTSPPNRGSNDSSPMVTSDPTSDSSDTGASGKCNSANNVWENNQPSNDNCNKPVSLRTPDKMTNADYSNNNKRKNEMNSNQLLTQHGKFKNSSCETNNENINDRGRKFDLINKDKKITAETSDRGYGTQIENQESTSSNEDDLPANKPVHQKPHNPKQRVNTKNRTSNSTLQDKKRKKIVKRGKSNIINVQGLSHKTPTDDDISNVLKEFTVDFLLKGYNSLVKNFHEQILANQQVEIDTSHFFWLVTYFLKFATQIELDMEHVCSVLSFNVISYITAEGVNMCEQFELAIKLDGKDLKPCMRRLHLVVTAIREFVQAIEVYKKSAHLSDSDQRYLLDLQMKMCETEDLRSLMVLLIRYYNPNYQSKQYLQDIVVTNHLLLMFMDGLMKLPEYKGHSNMVDHVRQFANKHIMYHYGLILEDYEGNGEFVNDCVFTVMHHVACELDALITLFQPKIIKTFTCIWKFEFEVCDDWSDLVEYVINTFVKKPISPSNHLTFRLEAESFGDEVKVTRVEDGLCSSDTTPNHPPTQNKSVNSSRSSKDRWSDDEISSLSWIYMQCNTLPDVVGEIVKLFKDDGIAKTRRSVIRQLSKQSLISKEEFDMLMSAENDGDSKTPLANKEMRDGEIRKLCEQLAHDDKSKYLDWVQAVLLETCNVKIQLNKKAASVNPDMPVKEDIMGCGVGERRKDNLPVLSPVSHHSLLFNQSVPLVPWNCEQAAVCRDLKFLQLLHKLGFHMPIDTGRVFVRIPNFWTPDLLYEVAAKISPIDTSKLKFSVSDISESSLLTTGHYSIMNIPVDLPRDIIVDASLDNFYHINRPKHLTSTVNFTPMPGSSYNSSNDVMNKSNWLEMVQMSQEYKLSANFHGKILPTVDEDIVMAAPEQPNEMTVNARATALPDTLLSPSAIGIKPETTTYNVHLESDCNNSICETESVASDLTRMYVSDEEDKDDVGEPLVATRPRVHFSPSFLPAARTLPEY